ncbi:hypothetical protein KL943_003177 [Ogataea angusta]|nr:hypothetical protein KL943_003177 [Ogataea angusta]
MDCQAQSPQSANSKLAGNSQSWKQFLLSAIFHRIMSVKKEPELCCRNLYIISLRASAIPSAIRLYGLGAI